MDPDWELNIFENTISATDTVGRVEVRASGSTVEVHVRAVRPPWIFPVLAICILMASAAIAGGVTVLRFANGTYTTISFCMFLLGIVTLGTGAYILLWPLAGREVLGFNPSHVWLSHKLFSFGNQISVPVSDILSIRDVTEYYRDGKPGLRNLMGMEGGTVRIDITDRYILFGILLSYQESNYIVDHIRKFWPAITGRKMS